MANYNNIIRPGTISSVSISPQRVLEDVDQIIRRLEPDSTPLVTLSQNALRGPKPHSFKVVQVEYDAFDHFDVVSQVELPSVLLGVNNYDRFARLKLDQPSRPTTSGSIFYAPQDTLILQKTGQNVQVVMTPTQALPMSDNPANVLTLPTDFTKGTASTTDPGWIIVRTVKDEPFIMPQGGKTDAIYLGRTIKESQDILATPHQRDVLYNCNFVEHMEAMIRITDDQKTWLKTKGTIPEFTWQQKELMWEFKRSVEYKMMWGVRHVDFTDPLRPTRYLEGLYHAIKTNVAVYNPNSITDFEKMLNNFLYDVAFRYNPNGYKKIALAGPRFLQNFNFAFKDFRRVDNAAPSGKVGLNFDTYVLPGGFELKFLRTDMLRMGTGYEDWVFVIDPKEIEIRTVKDFATRLWQKDGGRDWNLMVEWQGTIAWHREQAHALLKTV